MIDRLLSCIAPYACISCNQTGRLLCTSCTNEIIESHEPRCIGCGTVCDRGICPSCQSDWPVERAFIVGERGGVLQRMIGEFKFNRKRGAHEELAYLAGSLLPHGIHAGIVPVPTIAAHIRQRGYDHAALIARTIARSHGLTYSPLLRRHGRYVQHGASKRDRAAQIKGAFTINRSVNPHALYIIFDDITTTGASLKEAAHVLRAAGVMRIWVLAIALQPLDKPTPLKQPRGL